MAVVNLYNLARMTTATTGTGAVTLGSAVSGFLSFSNAGLTDGQTFTYAIEDGANSEIGRGVYTASGTSFTRSVLNSTNGNNTINLSGGAQVIICAAATDIALRSLLPVLNVLYYGATGNGSTDDTTSIASAITAATSANGGNVYFPPGNYKISSTLLITNSNVRLIGSGGDTHHDGGTGVSAATTLTWAGSAGGTMVKFATTYGASASVISGIGMEGIYLNGAASAAIGLLVDTVRGGLFRDLLVKDVTSDCYKITCGVTGTNTAEAADSQSNLFEDCEFRVIDSAPVRSANGFTLDGSSNANTSFNTFDTCLGQYWNGAGFLFKNADNNFLKACRPFSAGGSGLGFDIWAATVSVSGSVGGDCNYFDGCSWTSFTIRGTEQVGATAATINNQIITRDFANSAPDITLGTGASVFYSGLSAAWNSWTPTVTSSAGTLGTYTINRARYLRVGKKITFYADLSITSAGSSPSGDVRLTLPLNGPAVNYVGFCSGREQQNTGNWIGGPVAGNVGGGNAIALSMYSGAFAGGNGNRLIFGGEYEAA